MLNIDIFNTCIKLRVFNKRYNVLIIAENDYRLNEYRVKIKLIQKKLKSNDFFDNLHLINIFDLTN